MKVTPERHLVAQLRQLVRKASPERPLPSYLKEEWAQRLALLPPQSVFIDPTPKLGENVLFLPLFNALKQNFPAARFLVDRAKRGMLPPGAFSEVESEINGEYGIRIGVSFSYHDITLKIGNETVNLSLLSADAEDQPFYLRSYSFPWWLWGKQAGRYSFPPMDFPGAAEAVTKKFGEQLAGNAFKCAIFFGSSDYYGLTALVEPDAPPKLRELMTRSLRIWGIDNYVELIRQLFPLFGNNLSLFLVSGRSEEEKDALTQAMAKLRREAFATRVTGVPDINLRELYHLFKSMDLVISNDTGPAHLAYASGAQTLVLVDKELDEAGWYPSRSLVKNLDRIVPLEKYISEIQPETVVDRVRQNLLKSK